MILIALIMLLAANQSQSISIIENNIDLNVIDKPQDRKIFLIVRNNYNKSLCFGSTDWPTKGGLIETGDYKIYLEIEGKIYPIKDYNVGYPPHVSKVNKNKKIKGFFEYSSFNIPVDLYNKRKKLIFNPNPEYC